MNDYKQLFDAYFIEVNNISDMLGKYVAAYRALIDSAEHLNTIALARKKDVRDALKRANQLGDIIDVLLDTIENIECCYLDYITLKANVIAQKTSEESFGQSLGESIILAAVLSQLLPEDHPFFTSGQLGGLEEHLKRFKKIFPKGRGKKKGKDAKKDSKNDNNKNKSNKNNKDDSDNHNDHSDNHNDDNGNHNNNEGKEPSNKGKEPNNN